jgi:ribulose-5-phosphate 4-epimerase/fuculose-1-phosphate aldolase
MLRDQNAFEHEKEGVIKYQLQFHEQALPEDFTNMGLATAKPMSEWVAELNDSRRLLKAKALIGQDPMRYGGDGFGNISIRVDGSTFLISGSQTGHLDILESQDLALVEHFNIQQNQLSASGLTKPSSESMTHGVCFQASPEIAAVIHVHSPDIWLSSDALGLPFTDKSVPYGTPQMAQAVTELLKAHHQVCRPTIFAMKGHEDGIVAVGECLRSCTSSLLECLNQSILVKRHS